MTPEEKNAYQLQLIQLQSKFIAIGVVRMPTETILSFMPSNLRGVKAVKWANKASNVWNGRSMDFETYLPIFEKAYEALKETEKISA